MAKTNAIADLLGLGVDQARRAEGYLLVDYRRQLVGRDDNREIDQAAVRDLAESIERDGLAQPILARELGAGRYELIAGQHRCAAYALLAGRHPEQAPRWDRIECKVVDGMGDEQARRLMMATNVVDANHSPAERGRMLIELYGRRAAEIQAESGGRRREIIRDLYEEETGRKIGVNTVQRAIKAHEDEEAASGVDGEYSPEWLDDAEFAKLRPSLRRDLAALDEEAQRELYGRWSELDRPRAWLADQLAIANGRGESVAIRAEADAIAAIARIREAGLRGEGGAPGARMRLRRVARCLEEAREALGDPGRGEGGAA